MKKILLYLFFCFCLLSYESTVNADDFNGYLTYHKQVIGVEKLISEERFEEALNNYEEILDNYDFIFLRDYKIAAQLALYIGEKNKAFSLIRKGLATGWELKELKADKFLKPLQTDSEWLEIENEYDSLHSQYLARIDHELKNQVHLMFKRDQWKALGALFKIGDKAQQKYATKKFVPHSEPQIKELIMILETQGYPGERFIGNNYWMSTIISHHNSITQEYAKQDTLYKFIRPKLVSAIHKGEISPYEFALIDDWQKAVYYNRTEPGYGFLNSPIQSTLSKTDELRSAIGLRPVELRNKLIDIEKTTGMNFYLPNWINGKIVIENK